MSGLLLVQVASTWAMTSVIWFVQLVQYPSFGKVGAGAFVEFHEHHSAAITLIVGPLMIAEAVSSVAFLWAPLRVQSPWQIWLGIALVVLAWASTLFLQVPMHSRLASGFDEEAWRTLVGTNWIRTIAWSARAVLVSVWLYRTLHTAERLGV